MLETRAARKRPWPLEAMAARKVALLGERPVLGAGPWAGVHTATFLEAVEGQVTRKRPFEDTAGESRSIRLCALPPLTMAYQTGTK